ncbi:phosphotransacetylase [Desulfobacter latus]|uniref:Phosphotransacetylase n=1 Tax=Desulfobacter latus TaxID=2292 RepID=A0A850T5G1_9BACT|nr:phosphotransacetylase [Desulfobacter latus]NWH06331.1 phosphotransacetylase [Desulfobacter latus]
MNDLFNRLESRAKQINKTIVLPEGEDERIVVAAARLHASGIARPVLLGIPDKIYAIAESAAVDVSGVSIFNPSKDERLEKMAAHYCQARARVKEKVALRLVKKPLFFGCMLVEMGDADGVVGGATCTTTAVLQAAGLVIGYEHGVPSPSSLMLMQVPDFLNQGPKCFGYADPAVTVDPTAEELGAIAVQSGHNFRRFIGEKPRVAFLSFSSKGSGSHARVTKIQAALQAALALEPDFPMDGEFQADAAIVPRVAAQKIKVESKVAGQANVLVFPDLDSANIAYKLTQYMAGAEAIGPVLQGFRKPVNDLSRGCIADDIVKVAILTALQA